MSSDPLTAGMPANTILTPEVRPQRGKLKIFLGMAAGVGKTYAMLEAAVPRKQDGSAVVIGFVETHGRAEFEHLLTTFEQVPRRRISIAGVLVEEMDLDAVLRRRPDLVLVDDLVHTNARGQRHLQRYQDVLELLDAGIDVYTTVNVQHIESRADTVQQITGLVVRERIPDSLLDVADDVELVDLPPEELRKRLSEGKVDTTGLNGADAVSFYRTGNLTALREMALRLTAEHVNHKLRNYMEVKRIAGPWQSSERLMVAVGPSPFAERVIRWTRRMAYNLKAPWLAAYVETSETLAETEKQNLARNLELAQRLGAEIVVAAGDNVADTLLRLARQHNATQIVAGQSHSNRWWDRLHGGSLLDRLLRNKGDIDIFVVSGDAEPHRARHPLAERRGRSTWQAYLLALLAVVTVTGFFVFLFERQPWISHETVGLVELFVVLLVAVYLGRGPALLAALASALTWNLLFISPRFTLAISRFQDIVLLVLYFVIALIAGNLAARLRTQERQTRWNAERTQALYTLAHETATALDMDAMLHTAVAQIGGVFDAEVAIFLSRNGILETTPHSASTLAIDDRDFAVAAWVFDNGRQAGMYTDTLPQASARYLPLRTPSRTVGVLGMRMRAQARPSFDQEVLLEMFTNQVALVIERELLDEAARQTLMLRESERLYTTLLNSISHELRTPIATIAGASSTLRDPNTPNDPALRTELMDDIQSAAERLNRLVANLLDMSRLDSGRLKLKIDWCDVGEIIGVAAQRVADRLRDHPLTIDVAADLPLVQMDFVLMEQVLVNLLDNACNYTPPGTPLAVHGGMDGDLLYITVTDHGPGIARADMEHIFDKFYRVPGTATGGTGLGLSICRGLVEAHGGTLTAENLASFGQSGTRFTIQIPAATQPPPVREANL